MSGQASELSRRLAREAEAVCRAYLANGRRHGGYWTVGDIHNTPGRSLYVRLKGGESGPGAAGKWTDAATGEHGDLLDLIARARNLDRLGDVLDEARAFLSLPRPEWNSPSPTPPAPSGSPEAARRLFRAGRSLIGTSAESYLRTRGITASLRWPSLRYHPSVYYRAFENAPAKSGRRCWQRSPTMKGGSPASTAPGSIPLIPARRRWPIRERRSVICSATASALALPGMSSLPARASKQCWRSNRSCRPCP
jgi:hypothetical protein